MKSVSMKRISMKRVSAGDHLTNLLFYALLGVFVFTMYFSGGLIPTYVVINTLGLINTRTLLIILGSVSVYNIVLIRTFCQSSIPEELREAASIDGCSNTRFFFSIVLPLSKAILAVIALYIAVHHWNSYYNALVYTTDTRLQPLQLYLRQLLLINTGAEDLGDPDALKEMQQMIASIRYAVIVLSSLPMLCLILALSALTVSALADEEPVELTICTVRRTTDITASYSEKHWVQALEKACNVKIKWIELLEGQTDEQLTALLAGDLPDICKMHSTMHTTQGVPYINVKWLENLGLQKPTNMEELKQVLIAFRDQDANGNGDPNDEIPFDFCDSFNKTQLINCAASWGLPLYNGGNVFYDFDDEGNVVGAVNTDAYRSFLEFFSELGKEGLINLEGFSQSYDQFTANCNADRVGFFWGWGPCNYITDPELFLQFEMLVPPVAEGYQAKLYTANLDFANAFRNDFVITRACKNWEKALEVWNYASEPTTALDICNGERFLFWDYVDEEGNFLGEDATEEDIKNCGYHYLVKVYDTTTEEGLAAYNKLLTDWNYDWLVGKTFTGSNTTGLVDGAPLMLEAENYETDDLSAWGVQRYAGITDVLEPANVFCPYYMNKNIVPADAQEEFDFMTDGLYEVIRGYCAASVMNGVTDENWNSYLNDLTTYNYDYYVDFYNKLYHNEL